MCNFLSVLALKNGDILHHPMLDSHADLVTYFNLPDKTARVSHFAKIELTPVDWMKPDTWAFKLDEETAPVWWPDVAEQVEAKVRALAQSMIIAKGEKMLIVDGCWIIGGKAKVRDIRSGRIMRIQDSAQVSNVWVSARVSNVCGSAQVSDVRGSARVSNVWGSARVSNVWGSAQVSDVRGSARVSNVGDSARVSGVGDSAQVSGVGDSAQVSGVWGSAQVSGVGGSAQVSGVWGSAQVSDVRDSARVSNVGPDVILDDSAKAHLVKTVKA